MMNDVVDKRVAESHGTIHQVQLLVQLFLVILGLLLPEMDRLLEHSVQFNANCLSSLL